MCRILLLWLICGLACSWLCWSNSKEDQLWLCLTWSTRHDYASHSCKPQDQLIPLKIYLFASANILKASGKIHFSPHSTWVSASDSKYRDTLGGLAELHFWYYCDCICHCQCNSSVRQSCIFNRRSARHAHVVPANGVHVAL